MAKLYFRYGTVGSAKTLNLLAVAHNYRQQDKKVVLVKPAIDTRFGRDVIKTRAGLEAAADVVLENAAFLPEAALSGAVCVLVDEAQFLMPAVIDQFHTIAHGAQKIPVICYGLRPTCRRQLFPAAQRLLELADSIEEVKTICHYCLRKAVFNLKIRDGQATLDGPTVELGCEEKYFPVCARCYSYQHKLAAGNTL